MKRFFIHGYSVLVGASVLALALPTMAHAQRSEGGGYINLYWEEEPQPEEEAQPEPARLQEVVTPATYIVPAPLWTQVVRAIPAPPPPPPKYKSKSIFPFEDKLLDRVTAPGLETFGSDSAFARYREKLDDIKDDTDANWAGLSRPILIAAATAQNTVEDECMDAANCPEEAGADVVVTGTRVSRPMQSVATAVSTVTGTSITNVQTSGVDEGDIVKQIGDHLLVLQDGRIFAINMKNMKLTDRHDVYRKDEKGREVGADWYDEMLVQGDHILITAYSYRDDASEISVFKLDQASGKVSPRGVFLISSDDYYDVDNYATRIIGDRLVIYTPYELEQFEDAKDRPYLRRWSSAEARKDDQQRGKPLLDARNIYRPVLRTAEPYVHSISICPLGDFQKTQALTCQSTGFVGPRGAEMFVSNDNIYLWNAPTNEANDVSRNDCIANWDWNKPYPALPRAERKDVMPGAVYRLPVRGGEATVIGVSGVPYDQFSMDERDGHFRALADWRTMRCGDSDNAPAEVAFLSVHQSAFSTDFLPLWDSQFHPVPSPNKRVVENRFADDWLVYGGRDSWRSNPPDMEDEDQAALYAQGARLVAVPVKKPRSAQVIDLPHNIIRTERLGNDMIVNGYRDDKGLNMTLIGLDKTAKITSSLFLDKRYESEGRSHAFNATLDTSGAGIIGVPTVKRSDDSGRSYWRSDSSDISFITKAPVGTLDNAGALIAIPQDQVETHPDYRCEVSCIDWYGNSRPIFTGGRIFGLMGTALVEAEMVDGAVKEKARVDLTTPLALP